VPVIEGLDVRPTEDQLKALAAAGATTGRVALFHIVGVTPEAPTLNAACQNREPKRTIDVDMATLRAVRRRFSTSDGDTLDLVALGSPHFSLDEFRRLAPLLAGRHRDARVRFLVTTSRIVRDLADAAGLLEPLRAFGGTLTVDTCMLATPMLPADIRTIMTNSAKFAYYTPGMLDRAVVFGGLDDCVRSAVAGRALVSAGPWA
jgi:predicted aconitase